ncbi:G-protein coupled receptor 22-like isoform X1 [Brachyhypopomus gauderio]|uniref:G-protein coupled receptor 22-like isoform X1 n=1 Tax=Brachyhypopomus gauderio TaxID=698409 RepID=UPI00404347A5
MNNDTVHDHSEPLKTFEMDLLGAHYSLSFQVTLTSFLIIEILLGLSSNLTVLALYCMKSNLISSVSSIVTMNLHVLDVLVCIGCVPFTIAVVLLPLEEDTALVYCFHEACVSFASIATAANVLAITLDRYDISVRPANRVLTIERTVVLLGSIWALSLLGFLVPFIEVGFLKQTRNHTIEMENTEQGYTEAQLYYHLLAQIPIFVFTAVSMLVTYYKILQAFNIHIGTRFHKTPKKKSVKKQSLSMTSTQTESTEASERGGPNAIIALRRATEVSESRGGPNPALGSSVSAIITLRRAIKRHRERRERQRWAMAEGYGACLINNPQLVKDMVRHVRSQLDNPNYAVSIKIRVHRDVRRTVDLCQKAEAAGVSWITVHGRTPDERHQPVHYEAIRTIKDSLTVPVIANGDIRNLQDVESMHELTGVDGVMSARGLLANPALFAGFETTPLQCLWDWVDTALQHGTSFSCFHHHLIYMLERITSQPERKIFNSLSSTSAVIDYLQNTYGSIV